ncbi:MAG: PA2169 family four-helix-bundle protein [Bacteroidetes bacterium]|nr:PA2169 family four-helix-bundle protein [Bacteroidota bacterium]
MEKNNSTEALNTLLSLNKYRFEGYESATITTEEADLKILFARFATTSRNCHTELIAELNKLKAAVVKGNMASGKFFRIWADAKAALKSKDRKAILSACEYGEDLTTAAYEKILDTIFSETENEQKQLLVSHHKRLSAEHESIKSLYEKC